ICGLLFLVYEAVATGRFGRTLGKRWMHIRPVTVEGNPLGWGRSFGRAATDTVAGYLSWFGIIDAETSFRAATRHLA
ncbi:MAG: RDD family protein, partial [Solirubrobacteraceae bacterium]